MRDAVPLKKALERIIPAHLRALEEAQAVAPELIYTDAGADKWNDRMRPPPEPVKDWSKRNDAIKSAEHKIEESARAIFSSGAWLAWGVPKGAPPSSLRQPISVEDWERAGAFDYLTNRILFSHETGFEAVACAPLLSEAAKLRTPDIIAGRSLGEVFDCFVLADPEVQSLFECGRQDSEQARFGDAFTRAGGIDFTLPLSTPKAIAAALEPVIAGMMQERSAELLGALAARIDALVALLGSLRLNWLLQGDPRVATSLGDEFGREDDRLRLSDFALVGRDNDENPITDIAFSSAAELAAPESPERRKPVGSRPIYRDPLLELLREVAKDSSRARGFNTKNAIYGEIAKRAASAKPSRTLTAETAAKAFPLKGKEFEHAAMELVISIAKGLD